MQILAFICGLIFGFGLLISHMTDPEKVISFLNLAGAWDPSLILVMASALAVAIVPMQWASRRSHALLGQRISFPPRFGITTKLILGSAIFGVGWGIGGLCPGPSLAMAGALTWREGLFLLTMLIGMLAHSAWQRAVQNRAQRAAATQPATGNA